MSQRAYHTLRIALSPIVHTTYSIEAKGDIDKISGGNIIVANHLSYMDPMILVAGLAREIYFIMKDFSVKDKMLSQTYWGNLANLFSPIWLNGERITKDGLRGCLDVIERGDLLGIFPEGKRSPTGDLGELNSGTAKISRITGSKVIPVYIQGTWDIWPRNKKYPRPYGKIELKIGRALEAPNGRCEEDFMYQLREEFGRLSNQVDVEETASLEPVK